ncbi:MAG: SDR family NAD(P)-dependent oxidoreductase [Candidatus Bathyarchaeia archaeon]|jgi:3-oxoacyl-[acyl-carrier protein] reductase
MFEFKGKVALVTGAGRGIGKEIALTFARAGADVVVTDIADSIFETKKEIETQNVQCLAMKCDVGVRQDVENAKAQTLQKFPKLDILVNNAGIYPQKSFLEMTEDDWHKVMHVNLYGVFHFTKAFLPGMVERKYGKIINISSISGSIVAFPNLVHYSASKGGINGFTKALALEMAQYKINVNAVAPGPIDVGGMPADEATMSMILRGIPLGRMGKPADIAKLVLFLASDESDFITGQTIVSDGGYTLP